MDIPTRHKVSGWMTVEYMIVILVLGVLLYALGHFLSKTTDVHTSSVWIWSIASLCATGFALTQALFLGVPAGLWIYVPLALIVAPLTPQTHHTWAVMLIAVGVWVASMIAGVTYTSWFSTTVVPRHGNRRPPFYFDQRFNLILLLLVFIICAAAAGVVLLIIMPTLILLPVPPSNVPWLAPGLGLLIAYYALRGLAGRTRAMVIGLLLYVVTAVVARLVRDTAVGVYADNAWELIWYSVFWPLFVTGSFTYFIVAAKPGAESTR